MKYRDDDDDENLFDEHGVMRRDGTFRVPMRIMDSVQGAVIDGGAACGLHGPGFRLPAPGTAAAMQAEVNDALAATRKVLLSEAWQGPQPAPVATVGDARDRYIAELGVAHLSRPAA